MEVAIVYGQEGKLVYRNCKIALNLVIAGALLCVLLCPSLVLSSSSPKKISSDLEKAGYQTQNVTEKTIPMSNQNYFIVNASKDGQSFKIKVFKNKYFISGSNGSLKPLKIPQRAMNAKAIKRKANAKRGTAHLKRPSFSRDSTFDRKRKVNKENSSSRHLNRDSGMLNKGSEEFLANAEPTVNLGSNKSVSNASKSFGNGCYPVAFSRIASFGMGMQDTAKILGALKHKGGSQDMRLGRKVLDPSKDFKRSDKESSTDKIFRRASRSKNDPVSKSQKDLDERINSKEMHQYTMKQLQSILKGEKAQGYQTPDKMIARRNLSRLVSSLQRQGKSKREIYSLLNRQMKKQFSGNVSLTGKSSQRPWVMKSDGSLKVYSLTNNRDQVLSYAAQALTLKNDPIYNSKRTQWIKTNKELSTIKRNVTFQSDHNRIRKLENKLDSLSKDITSRQREIFS